MMLWWSVLDLRKQAVLLILETDDELRSICCIALGQVPGAKITIWTIYINLCILFFVIVLYALTLKTNDARNWCNAVSTWCRLPSWQEKEQECLPPYVIY